jgi:hypothetical protein
MEIEATVTVSNSVLTLGSISAFDAIKNSILRPTVVLIYVRTGAINITTRGLAPTTSTGYKVNAGERVRINGFNAVTELQMIRDGGSDATVYINVGASDTITPL